eukprot:scaffold205_cov407-Prasinococcus_capsulatus_cf.AAC.3
MQAQGVGSKSDMKQHRAEYYGFPHETEGKAAARSHQSSSIQEAVTYATERVIAQHICSSRGTEPHTQQIQSSRDKQFTPVSSSEGKYGRRTQHARPARCTSCPATYPALFHCQTASNTSRKYSPEVRCKGATVLFATRRCRDRLRTFSLDSSATPTSLHRGAGGLKTVAGDGQTPDPFLVAPAGPPHEALGASGSRAPTATAPPPCPERAQGPGRHQAATDRAPIRPAPPSSAGASACVR